MKLKKILILFAVFFFAFQNAAFAENVVFNTATKKIHEPGCPSVRQCTKNCITIERSEALKRGGADCKNCGRPLAYYRDILK